MKKPNPRIPEPDSAAIFAAALSIWNACNEVAKKNPAIDLSDTFNGIDELMRVAMALATRFEVWSCANIEFDRLSDWWPYKLEMELGDACLELFNLKDLEKFDDGDALKVAVKLRLPLNSGIKRLLPCHVHATNPVPEATFCRLSIRTIREAMDGSGIYPLTEDDDPLDSDYGLPFFGIYGVDASGESEHIADRKDFDEAVATVRKLIPGIRFG